MKGMKGWPGCLLIHQGGIYLKKNCKVAVPFYTRTVKPSIIDVNKFKCDQKSGTNDAPKYKFDVHPGNDDVNRFKCDSKTGTLDVKSFSIGLRLVIFAVINCMFELKQYMCAEISCKDEANICNIDALNCNCAP
jgi:hypothetical protein